MEFGHFDRYRVELGEPGRTTQRQPAAANTPHQFGLVAHTDLAQLDARAEDGGQVAHHAAACDDLEVTEIVLRIVAEIVVGQVAPTDHGDLVVDHHDLVVHAVVEAVEVAQVQDLAQPSLIGTPLVGIEDLDFDTSAAIDVQQRLADLSRVVEESIGEAEGTDLESLAEEVAELFPGDTVTAEFHNVEHHLAHLASAYYVSPFEEAVVDTLAIKCRRAVEQAGCRALVMAGGVSANRKLRARVDQLMDARGGRAYYPRPELCTDNGAMIAYAGWQRLRAGQAEDLAFAIRPRWPMQELAAG